MNSKFLGAFCIIGFLGFASLGNAAEGAIESFEFSGPLYFGTIPKSAKCDSYFSKFSQKKINYCYERSRPDLPAQKGEPVVYFFHSLTGDAKNWFKHGYSDYLAALRKKQTIPAMTFVTFDTETYSMFSDFGARGDGPRAYESWFIKDFIPMMEEKLNVCRQRSCRALAGLSMGGFGAIKIGIKYWDMFFMAAGNSPALPPFSPWESLADWTSYFVQTSIGPILGIPLVLQSRRIFPNESFAQHNDPAFLVEAFGDVSAIPYLYLDMGGRDEFGFYVGFKKLVELLNKRGVKYSGEYVQDGTHDLFKTRGEQMLRIIADGVAGKL
ncbi:MAG: alpha/beta hydrolase-fold protein [Bdellovibrionota bacterium]|mgnify:CR=1 FL=1